MSRELKGLSLTGYESGAVRKEPYEKRAVWIFEITEENSHCIENKNVGIPDMGSLYYKKLRLIN